MGAIFRETTADGTHMIARETLYSRNNLQPPDERPPNGGVVEEDVGDVQEAGKRSGILDCHFHPGAENGFSIRPDAQLETESVVAAPGEGSGPPATAATVNNIYIVFPADGR
jgi:hypothetical protein